MNVPRPIGLMMAVQLTDYIKGMDMNKGFIDFYRKLISINSISSEIPEQDVSNEEVIDFLNSYLTGKGFITKKLSVRNARNKFNLIAKIGEGDGGVALCGHTDTVPCDMAKWSSNPFELTERNNRLYGLGVIDMKGFFAFVYNIIERIDLSALKKPLYVIATGDEETNMGGAISLRDQFCDKPDLMIIGEPTSMVPVIMHKGHVVQGVRVIGKGGHSSNPDAGINAIKIMHEVVGCLLDLESELKKRYREDLFQIPYPTSNMGKIVGGDAPNRICESCEILFDIRPIPGHGVDEMMTLTREVLAPVLNKYPENVELYIPYEPTEPFGGKISDSTVKFLEEATGKKAIAVNYATEATYYQELSETVVLGPGSIDMAHQPDEYLDKDEIETADAVLYRIVSHYCL